jgi:uncharacterized protein
MRPLAAALALSLCGCVAREGDPERAFDKRDYATAAELWLRRAERGDRSAICPMTAALYVIHDQATIDAFLVRASKLMEVPYLKQLGEDEAAKQLGCLPAYFRRAADAGNPNAQYLLAEEYRGQPEAERLLELAAKNGSAEAQFDVGSQHKYDSDLSSTVYWWKLAAGQGYGMAQYFLSQLYRDGTGVPQDFVEAAKLLAQDAQQGSFLAQMAIGVMYEKGQGVPQDFVQAHFWFNVAGAKAFGENDRKQANEARDRIAQQMTSEQIAAAQRLARGWKASPRFSFR